MIGSIFVEPWWLEAVTDESYGLCTVLNEEHEKARLVFMKKRVNGLTRITMPPLTQFSGPWLESTSAKYATQLSQQKDLITSLLEDLPAFDTLNLNLDPSCLNGLPFIWKGFDVSVGFTYILEKGLSKEDIWQGFLGNIRREIRKAEKSTTVRECHDISILLEQIDKTFQRQGKTRNYSDNVVKCLDQALTERSQRKLLVAQDEDERVHAAAYFVWNQDAMHYLLGGGDPTLRNSGAHSLLIWKGLQEGADKGIAFNFEGSMIEGVERFFRAFGAKQTPYLTISRESRSARFRRLIRDAIGLAKGRK